MKKLNKVFVLSMLCFVLFTSSILAKSGRYGPSDSLRWEDGVDRNLFNGWKRVWMKAWDPQSRSKYERQAGAGFGDDIKYSSWEWGSKPAYISDQGKKKPTAYTYMYWRER